MPHMGMGELAILVVLMTVVVGGASWLLRAATADADERIRTRVARTHRTAIADVRDGTVVVVCGEVETPAGPSLRAPFSGRSAVAYHAAVRWGLGPFARDVARERSAVDFVVSDGTGRARVVARGARVALVPHVIETPQVRLRDFVRRLGAEEVAAEASCAEAVLAPGQRVLVMASARWESDLDVGPDSNTTFRDAAASRRLVLETSRLAVLALIDPDDLGPVSVSRKSA